MKMAATRAYAAEFLGTFLLAFTVLSLGPSPVAPFLAGFTLMLLVYLLGGISGCHINPGVTVGQWSIGKIKTIDAIPYLAAQLLGAAAAFGMAWLVFAQLQPPTFVDSFRAMAMEGLGTAMLSFGVTGVVLGKVTPGASGFAVGGSLVLGIVLASSGSLGVLNPAVSVSLRLFSLAYLVAPLVGGVIGAWVYRWMAGVPVRAK